MNREDIRDEIRRMVRDTDSSNYRWTDAVLNDRIDNEHDRIANLTKCIPSRITTNVIASTQEYSLPSTFIAESNVLWLDSNSYWQPLEKKTETELDLEVSNWRHETSDTPTFFYIRRSYIGIVLTPNFSKTNGLRVDFFRRPDAFTLDTDIPFDEIPELYPFHDSICYAVTIKCKQDEGDWISAEKLQLEFYKRISEIKEQVSFKNEETRLKNIYETVRSAPRRTR